MTKRKLFIQKQIFLLFLLTTFMSCNSSFEKPNSIESLEITNVNKTAFPDSVVKILMKSASDNFHKSNLRMPITFQDVKVGYIVTPQKEKYHMLSGQFLSQERNKNNEWVPFAYVKKSGVEQLNGTIAMSFYIDSQEIIDKGEYLTSALKREIWKLQLSEYSAIVN